MGSTAVARTRTADSGQQIGGSEEWWTSSNPDGHHLQGVFLCSPLHLRLLDASTDAAKTVGVFAKPKVWRTEPHGMEPASTNSVSEARRTARSSLYLLAALYCDGSSAPVKIRNLSPTGALVEGSTIPGKGSPVQLVRGRLSVAGSVVWSDEVKCGLEFFGPIDIDRWHAASANCEQGRVDEIVRVFKASAATLPVSQATTVIEQCTAMSDDLRLVSELLGSLGDALANNAVIAANYGPALQKLDIAMQVIAAFGAMMDGDNNPKVEASKLDGLRRSAQQALR